MPIQLLILFIMAQFSVSGNTKVQNFMDDFKAAFGATLRVYQGKGKQFADPKGTVAKAAFDTIPRGTEFTATAALKVSSFEARCKEVLNLTVQVATPDDSALADNNAKLGDFK